MRSVNSGKRGSVGDTVRARDGAAHRPCVWVGGARRLWARARVGSEPSPY